MDDIKTIMEKRKQWYLDNEFKSFGNELPQFIQLRLNTKLRTDLNVIIWMMDHIC